MEAGSYNESEEPKTELDGQFILRLPLPQAEVVSTAIRKKKAKKFKKLLATSLDQDKREIRTGTVKVKKQQLHAKLVDLPCIVESYKTIDKAHLYKTADISQMLICQKDKFDLDDKDCPDNTSNSTKTKAKPYAYPHGIAPPLKNVKKQRFRKILQNKEDLEEIAQIEKEVLWLLRADNEAVSTRFEIYYEEPNRVVVNECTIFGEVISDSDSNPKM